MNTPNAYIMYFLENVFICAVNVFVLISGYFMCEKKSAKTIKAIELVFQVVAFNAAILILRIIMSTDAISWQSCLVSLLPVNYYVTLYVVLFLLAPYINMFLNNLDDNTFKKFVIIIMMFFSVWPTILEFGSTLVGGDFGGMNTIGIGGSQNGYTIVNFVLMYILGAYLRRIKTQKASSYYLIRLLICWVLQFALSYTATIVGIGTGNIWAYCNPFVIMSAVCSFMFFKGLTIQNKYINELAKASFTVYLLHMLFVPRIKIELFVNGNPLVYVGHVIISCIVIYLICYIVYKIYDLFASWVFKNVQKVIRFPEIECKK